MAATKYGSRSAAIRAAKKSGLAGLEVVRVWEEAGKSHWAYQETKPTEESAPVATDKRNSAAPVDSAPKLIIEDYADQLKTTKTAESPAAPVAAQAAPETKQSDPTPSPAPPTRSNIKPAKSTVEKPTKAVWAIADEMKKANPQVTRKEVVDECVRRGIAFHTARTQYQRWAKSNKV